MQNVMTTRSQNWNSLQKGSSTRIFKVCLDSCREILAAIMIPQSPYYDPDHKGALEYQGKLFVALGRIDRARSNADKLEYLYVEGCNGSMP